MSHFIGLILTVLSLCSISKALPDFHKRMSPQQLQSVFHVDSAASVPHYEVVQLLHHHTKTDELKLQQQQRRHRRSINVVSVADGAKETHRHVKKNLSKSPYYSQLKLAAAAAAAAAAASGSVKDVQSSRSSSNNNSNDRNNDSNSMSNNVSNVIDHRNVVSNENIVSYGRNVNNVEEREGPDSNLVDVRTIKEHNVAFAAFGENLNLTLRATEGLFKHGPHKLRLWTVRSEPNATHGLDMQEVLDESSQSSEEIGEVFQDEANMAAILMRRHLETGDLMMEGSIGNHMIIKPLPHNLSPHKNQTHHIVYKRNATPLDHLSDFAFMEPDDLVTSAKLERLQQRKKRSVSLDEMTDELAADIEDVDVNSGGNDAAFRRAKRTAPYIIYPEVLVIVDYDGYRLHGGDNLQVKRYFISFWNGVDLRYRLLKGPRIRISIAGIIISRGRDATPYLERNRVGRDAIDSAAALTDMGKYLFRERRLPVYDIAVAITKYDMCRRRKGGRCTKGTAGFAYVGGACVVNKRLEKVNSVAIIEDTGGFSGIIVAAHEVGHLLGAVHDGSPPPSYLGGPGAQRCRWEDGYIMSDLRHTERGFRWSPCTVQSFHHFLNGDTATCLHNAPHEDGALGRSLPGTLLSLDAQCRRDRGTYACFKDQRVCAQLFCFDAQTGYCVAYRPAAEGSSCGNGMQCLDGRCQTLASNDIPDFEKEYRVVYNLTDADDGNTGDSISSSNYAEGTEDDDESNEAIERRNRNLYSTITTSGPQQHRQLQQQLPTATTSTPIKSYTADSGEHRSTPRSHTFFDAYFKRLEAINASQQQRQPLPSPSPPTTTVTTSVSSTTSTTSSISTVNKKEAVPLPALNSYENFGAQFLKRTLSNSKNSSRNSSRDVHNSSSDDNRIKKKYKPSTTTTTTTPPATYFEPVYVTNFVSNFETLAGVTNSEMPPRPEQKVKVEPKLHQNFENHQEPEQIHQQQASPQQKPLKTHKFTRRQLKRIHIK